jgi:multiple antibiotic resistance protein
VRRETRLFKEVMVRTNRHFRASVAMTLVAAAGCLVGADPAWAVDAAADPVPARHIPAAQVFTLLFLMLGPFKIVGPFLKLTKGADDRLARRIAVRAPVFSALALLVAGFLGETILNGYGIPLPVLALSGGIILFLVALKTILEQFELPEPPASAVVAQPATDVKVALMPLAFPRIVTPYGIAALVVFLAYSQTLEGRLAIGAIVVAIMGLNLLFMLAARRLLPVLGLALPIFGAVLGVVQVALGLQIINNALHTLGVL